MIKYQYAKDKFDKLVNIDEVTSENRASCYYCVGCGGEMVAALGEKNIHHFRHKVEHACDGETYLHKLGKKYIKQKFEQGKEFLIKYFVDYHCEKSNECKFSRLNKRNCNQRGLYVVDLKKEYDTCEEESTYKGFRADLKFSSKANPNLEPTFFEISVKHDCEAKKLESGIRIIEIKISDEKDLLQQIVEKDVFSVSADNNLKYQDKNLPPVRFYNFERNIVSEILLDRFWIEKDENNVLRGGLRRSDLKCSEVGNNHRDKTVYELAIIPNGNVNIYWYGLLRAVNSGIIVKHCALCYYINRCIYTFSPELIDKETGAKKYTFIRKPMNMISESEVDKFKAACNCKHFLLNSYGITTALLNYRSMPPSVEWKDDSK